MEEKNDLGLKHVAHQHLLILNENYIAKEGVVCWGCNEQIDSCKSFVYSCSNRKSNITSTTDIDIITAYWCSEFVLHKTCAESPLKIVNPTDQNEFLFFESWEKSRNTYCIICGVIMNMHRLAYCSSFDTNVCVCVKCAVFQVQQSRKDPIFEHPGHSHPLALIEDPSSFKCYVCKINDNVIDLSYRCTECRFWIHKSCGDAPASFQFHFHKHPLSLSFSLPKVYRKFYQFCRICNKRLHWIEWLYCCHSCRYFTHFQCARSRSNPILRNETYPNLVHLPAADELSLNQLLKQLIKDKFTLSDSYKNSSISSTTNYIKHWSHEEHDLKLITINELYDGKNDDEILLLCDGCVLPIRTSDSLFYACVPCKYFMHKVCADLPREIEHHFWPGETLFANKYSEPIKLFKCYACESYGNGIFFSDHFNRYKLHIGCVTLPKVIKHEAHHHQLQLDQTDNHSFHACNACGYSNMSEYGYFRFIYGCEDCRFYICGACIMKAKTYKHRWDPHPMDLIYDAGMVEEHEHEFDCECCSEEINTNYWFYHCSKCDLSFHTPCIESSSYRRHKDVKFGATDIIIKDKLHPHALTFALSKKFGPCMNCNKEDWCIPVLHCAPCQSTIFCYDYWWRGWCWN